jgi:hypothetical protein
MAKYASNGDTAASFIVVLLGAPGFHRPQSCNLFSPALNGYILPTVRANVSRGRDKGNQPTEA